MPNVLLDQWQAIELFSLAVCKYELQKAHASKTQPVVKLDDFSDNDILLKYLRVFRETEASSLFAIQAFGLQDVHRSQVKNSKAPKHPKLMYDLSRWIRSSEPVVISDKTFSDLVRYVGKDESEFRKRELTEWKPSTKQREFEKTHWWLYYYDEFTHIHEGYTVTEPGITRAILHLMPFGRAEIRNLEAKENKKETYAGTFEMYGNDAKYMRLTLKVKDDRSKDLNMLFYIGTGINIELAIGEYYNVNGSIYAGTIMIQPRKSRGTPKATFFASSARSNDIPAHVWEFFEDKRKNTLRVADGITTVAGYTKWKKMQKMKDNAVESKQNNLKQGIGKDEA